MEKMFPNKKYKNSRGRKSLSKSFREKLGNLGSPDNSEA